MYQNNQSEQFLGQLLSSIRSEAVIATKYTIHPKFKFRKDGEFLSPNSGGNGKKSMAENLAHSLKSLQTGYVDLFYVHNWEYTAPLEEVMRGLDDVVRSGKALYTAISDTPAWVVSRGHLMAQLKDWSPFIALQTRYNLLDRSLEGELGPMATNLGMGICAWGVLAEGFLTGKHSKDQKLEQSGRNESVERHFSERNEKILGEVKAIAQEIEKTPSQVSINWTLQRPSVIPILGAKNLNQFEDNLGALEFTLSKEQMKRLNDVSNPALPFPQIWPVSQLRNNLNSAGLHIKVPPDPWAV